MNFSIIYLTLVQIKRFGNGSINQFQEKIGLYQSYNIHTCQKKAIFLTFGLYIRAINLHLVLYCIFKLLFYLVRL